MYISALSLDDLLHRVYERLLSKKLLKGEGRITATKGPNVEIPGVLLLLKNPRMRLSRTERKGTLFSCLGEWLWYMSGSNDVEYVKYYIGDFYDQFAENDGTVHGAYGPRIRGLTPNNQIERVIDILKKKPTSRQAVIQIFDSSDLLEPYKDTPCTCTMQFLVRGHRLHMIVYMRSNDAFKGLPHDIFAFTLIQELIARSLNIEIGVYKHSVGSLHLYDEDRSSANDYLQEGWQDKIAMPPMPIADPWESINSLLEIELSIRTGKPTVIGSKKMEPYWKDMAYILKIFKLSKSSETIKNINPTMKKLSSNVFKIYIDKRQKSQYEKLRKTTTPKQLSLISE